jgi:predicted  nucleic acid-binding Zn-ribbon protein
MPPLFADAITTTLTEVGGVVGVLTGLYLLWERFSKRRTERRKEDLANQERQLKLDGMARDSIEAAYDDLMRVRKQAHDGDIANLKLEIGAAKLRLAELEKRETTCQETCKGLQAQNTEQAVEIAAQAREIIDLRAKIESLETKLRQTGALPGSGSHTTLRTDPD